MKKYTYARIGLCVGLLSLNILSSCVSTRQGMDGPQGGSITPEVDTQNKQDNSLIGSITSKLGAMTALGYALVNWAEQKKDDEYHKRMVRILIQHPQTDVNKVGGNLTSLLFALKIQQPKIAQFLLDECGDRLDVESKDPDSGGTALHMAAEKGYGGVVDLLLSCSIPNRSGRECECTS